MNNRRARFAALIAALLVVVGCATLTGTSQAVTGQTIFGGQTSGINTDPDSSKSTVGMQFRVAQAGTVDAVRVHRSAQITGALTGKVARGSTVLATVTLPAAGAGWQEVGLPSPVSVVTGQTYTVYYTAPAGRYSVKSQYAWPKVSGDLTAVKGVYTFGNGVPASVYNNENYWVDVVFNPAALPPTTTSASPTSQPPPTTTVEPTTTAPTTTAEPTPTTTAPTTTTTQPPVGWPPTGFPDASNTGYRNAPGYPGQLHECPDVYGNVQSGARYEFCDFTDGMRVRGPGYTEVQNVTFYGCRFQSSSLDDANVVTMGDNIRFEWSSFEPPAGTVVPVARTQGYQYGIDQRADGAITVDHSDFWGFSNGIEFYSSTQAKPFVVRDSYFHDPRDDGNVDHTDGILSNEGGPTHMVFDHNTIVGDGNTQGLALQTEQRPYSDVTITNNYFSGFGYSVAISENHPASNVTFTGNVLGTDVPYVYGPLYSNTVWDSAQGNVWRNNKWHVKPGTTWYTPVSDDGKYWLPGGSKSTTDHTG